ncbi:SDR family oxidoreductase [Sagittula stellata]|uniref:Putative oxidoreductase protein n=1 Tax=Sagittula stellata (strain ATCC 700073 / DSM 11524 / E-37) TaxID=388399 RepID=A3K709_SAGS3|nr:SDR family oxidoreductase [Sagittula stellata]EBA07136.1 putative oxidoreductase protein [Sagittula stellata E-37]
MTQAPATARQTVLILGAYGLIGTEICRTLHACGHRVIASGRSAASAAKALPMLPFRRSDLSRMEPSDWTALVDGVDVIVNCAGALQDGPGDDLERLHHHAVKGLGETAAARGIRVVQISAAGVRPDHPTVFFASKARGDAALLASGANAVILRPGLVIGQSAYGGTTLLRMLAAVPLIQPQALPATPIQTVSLADLAEAVAIVASGHLPRGHTFDLVEDQTHSLSEIIAAHRRALGFPPARATLTLPRWMLAPTARIADALAHLGWRSPLRSTAIEVLADGVTGDPRPWQAQTGSSIAPLQETLTKAHLGPEHRLQARATLLMPLAVATLSLFWLLSGIIGLCQIGPAAEHLTRIGWPQTLATASVGFWAVVDVVLGLAILYRPFAARACLAMIGVSLIYIASATVFTPGMWADPLGPLVKVLPAMMLAAVTPALLETR